MKNKEQFDWAVGVLVKAYMNDTLERGSCRACAVGNLVGAAMNYSGLWHPHWDHVHCVTNRRQRWFQDWATGEGLLEIGKTGYTPEETANIEWAFEMGGNDMFDGLMSVIDCLIEIHEGDEEEKIQTKLLFQKL